MQKINFILSQRCKLYNNIVQLKNAKCTIIFISFKGRNMHFYDEQNGKNSTPNGRLLFDND